MSGSTGHKISPAPQLSTQSLPVFLPLGVCDTPWVQVPGLRPVQSERLQRLPLPPSIQMGSWSSPGAASQTTESEPLPQDPSLLVNPYERIQQLEKNIKFMRESHALILSKLHEEIEKLKNKNRDLQFKLILGYTLSNENSNLSAEVSQRIDSLEKEVHHLRLSLKDAYRKNTSLASKLDNLKDKKGSTKDASPSSTGMDNFLSNIHFRNHSPKIEEYSDTLQQIQRASHRTNELRKPSTSIVKLPKIQQISESQQTPEQSSSLPFPPLKQPLLPLVTSDKSRKPHTRKSQ